MRRATYIKICKVGIIVMSAIAIYSTVMSTLPEEDVDDLNIDPKVLQYLKPKPPRKNVIKAKPTLKVSRNVGETADCGAFVSYFLPSIQVLTILI
jgi:hypothetical protein